MAKQSAGLLCFRRKGRAVEVLLVHPGGPFWAKKDAGAWSVPKGEFTDDEDPQAAAQREFSEETGLPIPPGDYTNLGEQKQSSGKVVHVWACEADCNLEQFRSNMFSMEWPPKSGQTQEFPEADRAAWLPLAAAKTKLVKGQVIFIDRLAEHLGISVDASSVADDATPQQSSLF